MIITNNEDVLRVECADVLPEEVSNLIETLESELSYANKLGKNGIGLAAPQIGIAKKIAIIRMEQFNVNLINAKIVQAYDPAIFRQEGCLSFPGRTEDTTRFQEVHISGNLVEPTDFVATGMFAVVCQHELDHLNGTLFLDKIVPKQKTVISSRKVGPNDACVCASGRKYKKCCGRNI